MKTKIITYGWLIAALLLSSFTGEDCDKELKKISAYYTEHFSGKKLYLKFSTQTTENAFVGEKLINEMWVDGQNYKYTNPYLIVVQDAKTQVMILKDRKLIVLRNADKKDNALNKQLDVMAQIDSLKKSTSKITCRAEKKLNVLELEFEKKFNNKPNPFRRITIQYAAEGEIKKGEYEYYAKVSKTDTFEYLEHKNDFPAGILKASALAYIYDGENLLAEYKNYSVRNLRSKNNK